MHVHRGGGEGIATLYYILVPVYEVLFIMVRMHLSGQCKVGGDLRLFGQLQPSSLVIPLIAQLRFLLQVKKKLGAARLRGKLEGRLKVRPSCFIPPSSYYSH